MPLPGVIKGKGGVTLKDQWNGTPRAYWGITVPNFPNFCMLYGPNTNLGHNSIIFMMESQMDHIIKIIL
jgi:cation diffusion facilitator CzcD-associated flavoprotein CzcO